MLETVNAMGEVIPPFIVWANKVHCVGFHANDNRPTTFSQSPSGYMHDKLGLDYISKYFDRYIAQVESVDLPSTCKAASPTTTYRLLIVDGHTLHITWSIVEYAPDHHIIVYCLPPYSTHLMQPLDVACFRPSFGHINLPYTAVFMTTFGGRSVSRNFGSASVLLAVLH